LGAAGAGLALSQTSRKVEPQFQHGRREVPCSQSTPYRNMRSEASWRFTPSSVFMFRPLR